MPGLPHTNPIDAWGSVAVRREHMPEQRVDPPGRAAPARVDGFGRPRDHRHVRDPALGGEGSKPDAKGKLVGPRDAVDDDRQPGRLVEPLSQPGLEHRHQGCDAGAGGDVQRTPGVAAIRDEATLRAAEVGSGRRGRAATAGASAAPPGTSLTRNSRASVSPAAEAVEYGRWTRRPPAGNPSARYWPGLNAGTPSSGRSRSRTIESVRSSRSTSVAFGATGSAAAARGGGMRRPSSSHHVTPPARARPRPSARRPDPRTRSHRPRRSRPGQPATGSRP